MAQVEGREPGTQRQRARRRERARGLTRVSERVRALPGVRASAGRGGRCQRVRTDGSASLPTASSGQPDGAAFTDRGEPQLARGKSGS